MTFFMHYFNQFNQSINLFIYRFLSTYINIKKTQETALGLLRVFELNCRVGRFLLFFFKVKMASDEKWHTLEKMRCAKFERIRGCFSALAGGVKMEIFEKKRIILEIFLSKLN